MLFKLHNCHVAMRAVLVLDTLEFGSDDVILLSELFHSILVDGAIFNAGVLSKL